MLALDEKVAARLHTAAEADRWGITPSRFALALAASVERAFRGRTPGTREVEQYLAALHLRDLALACACADGVNEAWNLIVREHRPALYRSADALDPSGGARELADGLYGELYERSLFRYYHGRSSLITWLRSVLAQRHVDAIRARRKVEPLPEDPSALPLLAKTAEPDARRLVALMAKALGEAVPRLAARERLRLRCYYAQQMTLAEISRLLREHEATASRALARTRKALRADIEDVLRRSGLDREEIARSFELTTEDAGPLDLDRVFSGAPRRKVSDPERSE